VLDALIGQRRHHHFCPGHLSHGPLQCLPHFTPLTRLLGKAFGGEAFG
jgi:hypothetical protein